MTSSRCPGPSITVSTKIEMPAFLRRSSPISSLPSPLGRLKSRTATSKGVSSISRAWAREPAWATTSMSGSRLSKKARDWRKERWSSTSMTLTILIALISLFNKARADESVMISLRSLFTRVRGRGVLRSSGAKRRGTALRLGGWLRKPIWSWATVARCTRTIRASMTRTAGSPTSGTTARRTSGRPRAPFLGRGPARHPLGIVRPARLRRVDSSPRPGRGVAGRRRLRSRRRAQHRPVRAHGSFRRRFARRACAALLPERILGVVVVAGMAPFDAEGLEWFEGFGPAGVAELRAAAAGRAALEKHLAQSDDEPEFTHEVALAGEWLWFIDVVR